MSDIKETISDLQNRINQLKGLEKDAAWQKWTEDTKEYTDKLIGRCFISDHSQRQFTMFKVIDCHHKFWLAQPDYKGFFELVTEGYFHVYNTNYMSKINSPQREKFGTFTVFEEKYKPKRKVVSKLDYNKLSVNRSSDGGLLSVICIGREDREYKSYVGQDKIPPAAWEHLPLFLFEVPEHVYNEALEIAKATEDMTVKFWENNIKDIQNAERLR